MFSLLRLAIATKHKKTSSGLHTRADMTQGKGTVFAMQHLKCTDKLRTKRGFTLAELLIVVAIIAILAAIAIPLYTAQLEKTRESVDKTALTAATSLATLEYLMGGEIGTVQYYMYESDVATSTGARNLIALKETSAPAGYKAYVMQSKRYTTYTIEIGTDGQIISSTLS